MAALDRLTLMLCCLNPDCEKPLNPDGNKYCHNCSTELVLLAGHYRVIQLLSDEGGFGRTYLAQDEQKLNEPCVVKQSVPRIQGTSGVQKALALFAQEAQRLQELGGHPQIPTLFAYFAQDQYFYLVQQYIEGQNLLQELQQHGPYNEHQIRELLRDLLPVLKFVHEHQVIHRDIKPQNIMRRRGDGRLVLIDFGASKQLKATVMANIGTRIGSEGYAPIEQIRGGEAYPASDLFNLGVTCFHLLSGLHPFNLWTEHGYGWITHWRQYLQPPVSPELGHVLDKLLQKDMQQRYQAIDEVIKDLTLKPQPAQYVKKSLNYPYLAHLPLIPWKFPTIKLNTAFLNKLVLGATILLVGISGTQIYGYLEYGLFPVSAVFLMKSFNSRAFLKKTLLGHSSSVNYVVMSPNGQMVSASSDNTIKLWNLKTGGLIRTLRSHSHQVNALALSPNGEILASASSDKTVKLWDLKTGEELHTFYGHSSYVYAVAFSPDGQTLVSGGADGKVILWSLRTEQRFRTLSGYLSYIYALAISPNGKILATGSSDNTIQLWNLKTGQRFRTLTGHSGYVDSIAFSPDGQTLASGSADNTIKLWKLKTGEEIRTLIGHSGYIYTVAFNPDGQTLASGSADSTIKLWNLETGEELQTLIGHSGYVDSVAFSPDGQTLASGGSDNTIKIWQVPK